MIRQPTPLSRLYGWHRDALAGKPVSIHEADPQCGWFKTRFVKGGPFVPASIFIQREVDLHGELAGDESLACEINGQPCDPVEAWLRLCKHPISRSAYLALKDLQRRHPAMAATHVPLRLAPGDIRP